ncbi:MULTISPECIES: histidine phosphatase family protein [Bacillus]|uniref:histidine phosphatase family protein n=1 Tax=Bacillus TaxID=1386 RepID=UPI000BB73FA9|nr:MULTISPECIES: histidine phosphatase family protein [Bacillus]
MKKVIYVVRHCKAEGQPAESALTPEGHQQAIHLVELFKGLKIDRIISSPFKRAVQSIEPLSKQKQLEIELDTRLEERILCLYDMPDWLEALKATYNDMDLKFFGGESSREAMERVISVINAIKQGENVVIVSHGNLISLLLKSFDDNVGYNEWLQLSNPDVFQLKISNNYCKIQRLWSS